MPFVHKKDFINKSERAFWLVSNLVQVVFILTDQHKDKQEILLYNVAESHNKKICVCVCIFFQLHWKGVEDETNSVLSPENFWIISKALEFFYKCPHEQSVDVISPLCELEGSCTSKEAEKD